MPLSITDGATRAAVAVAGRFGVLSDEPVVLADGANVVVHLRPAPVVAKVAASTPAVRPDNAAWLGRELALAQFLAARNVPVMIPSPEFPASVQQGGGYEMSFWDYLGPDEARPDEATIGSMLRELHGVLREYETDAPFLAPLADIPAFLARPQTLLTDRDVAGVTEAFRKLTAELGDPQGCQAVHGDAGAGNLMAAGGGWVWHDFEDTCRGPLAWDLAASTASKWLDRTLVLAAYGDPVDPGQLHVCEQLRRLHLTVWYSLYAERLPGCRQRATELLALWPAP